MRIPWNCKKYTLSKRHGLVKIVIQQYMVPSAGCRTNLYTQVLIKHPINGFVYFLKILTSLQKISYNTAYAVKQQ